MSYLDACRLIFSGDFQADVSTVNNDVRHYDSATFESRFQQTSEGLIENGWWNPTGSHAFRLIDCRIRAVAYGDDTTATRPDQDAAIGLVVGGSRDRVSGKLVDVDPQWQMASEIWGLDVALVDTAGVTLMQGRFEPASFRDIQFGRQSNAGPVNGQSASAMFVSVLRNVTWNEERLVTSRALTELKAASAPGLLSIRLTNFGYFTRADRARFTLGTVSGAIGPADAQAPHTFIPGRRFAPVAPSAVAQGLGFFTGILDRAHRRVRLDLSNALPISSPSGAIVNQGALHLAILRNDTVAEGQPAANNADIVGEIPYRSVDWLTTNGGIFSLPLTDAQVTAAAGLPLALVLQRPGAAAIVAVRETAAGRYVRADRFLQRVDAGESASIVMTATKFGEPLPAAPLVVQLVGPTPGLGGGSDNDPNPPTAPIPTINEPAAAVSTADTLTTDAQGRATCTVATSDPGNPRGYVDGQIYLFAYDFADAPQPASHRFDFMVLHVRDAFAAPAAPNWQQHIAPILVQFGNLYPVMSDHIVNLTDYEDVRRHRAALELALSLDLDDPNHMPVTRDLSKAKRDVVLAWLREKNAAGEYVLRAAPEGVPTEAALAAAEATTAAEAAAEAGVAGEVGGKVDFLKTIPRTLRGKP
jgi:hypothetical protein